MKQRVLLITLLLFVSMSMFSQHKRNTFDSEWKRVEEYGKKSLPKSAIKEVESILDRATKENNIPQVLQSYYNLQKLEREIDHQTKYNAVSKLDQLLTTVNNASDKAIVHSYLAEIYYEMYASNKWQINQRTQLVNEVPDDINEWTANIFEDKIFYHLQESIKEKNELLKASTKDYADIIKLGVDSEKLYQHSFYDFVMVRAISIAQKLPKMGNKEFDLAKVGLSATDLVKPATAYVKLDIKQSQKYIVFDYYQHHLNSLIDRELTNAIILIELGKFNYIKSEVNSFDSAARLETLLNYEQIYAADETTVEIIDAIVEELYSANNDNDYSPRRRIEPIIENQKEDNNIEEIYRWLQKGISKYPNYHRINILKTRLDNLKTPYLDIEGKNTFYPADDIVLNITHKNNQIIDKEKMLSLYKLDGEKEKFVKDYPIAFSSAKDYQSDSTKLEVGKLPVGAYYLKSKLNYEDREQYRADSLHFIVSNLMAYSRNSFEDEYEIHVVDKKNGKPIKGATITIGEINTNRYYSQEKISKTKLLKTLTTNSLGIAVYKDIRTIEGREIIYGVQHGADNSIQKQYLEDGNANYYEPYDSDEESLNENTISIFIDRSVYRPGQTVHMKSIIIDKDSKVLNNQSMKVKLHNMHGEIFSEETLQSNEFGSISKTFILPQGCLLGLYWITVNDVNPRLFSVEEYKRPTFEVKFDKIEKTYKFGEKITLKGNAKTFSGISLQDTNVEYRISRRPFSFWFWSRTNESHYQDGIVKTKDDGSFEVEFTPESGDGKNMFGREIYTFEITAKITDQNGETQSGNYTVSVGEASMILNVEIPEQIEKSQYFKINIGAKNLDGADITTSGICEIYSVDKNDSIQVKVFDGTFSTSKPEDYTESIKQLESGRYRIIVKGKDDNGKDVEGSSNFILYSYSDKKPPYETDRWLVKKETIFKGKKPVEIIFGTSKNDIYILYQLFDNKTLFESKYVKLNGENYTFNIPYQAKFGEQVNLAITTVIDGEVVSDNITLQKEEEKPKDTTLKLKLSVFRDKLRPGQEETWTLNVQDTLESPVLAEVLASMYDTSLDKIAPFRAWTFNRPYIYKEDINALYYNYRVIEESRYNINFNHKFDSQLIPAFQFDESKLWRNYWNYYGSDTYILQKSMTRSVALQGKVAGLTIATRSEIDMDLGLDEAIVENKNNIVGESGALGGAKEGGQAPVPQIRKNFNETAFFFPQLKTNEKGETLISFTVPESNTTWRFRSFAHNKEGKTGEIEKMVVTRKELMVTPNMPRFIRHGDKTSIATKISNLSENSISGDVYIEFFDPISEEAVNIPVNNKTQNFSIEKDASTSAAWTFDVPTDIDLLGVRIVAQSEAFSDGEQHALAVLPNRMLVTETMPVDVLDKGEQSYTLDKLANNKSKTIANYKLSFEFASNPAWYAVQALPTLDNPINESATNWFASYYVTTLGASIMKQYPKVGNVIQAWKKQDGSKETLISKLYKNEELKTILLEETPWVLDAKSETESMERLSLLFDINYTKQQTTDVLNKLKELQTSEGGWPWYKGFQPNRSTTQFILYGFANLQTVGMVEYSSEVKKMQIDALKFIDNQIVSDYKYLKKNNKDWKDIKSISIYQLEFIFVRAMYSDIPLSHEAHEARRFYTDVVSKYWTTLGLYEKSLLATYHANMGDKALAASITKSIKEYSVTDKEMGMYWPNNKNNIYRSMAGTNIHTFMMKSLKENGATTQEMDNMKRWLVKQKQTQAWETTLATIEAIGTLLGEGSDWFSSNAVPTIKVGSKVVEPESRELATGYFKTSWSASEIKNDMAKVSITSEDTKPAFGALYWQYYEDLDKIIKQDGALNVNKELYKEVTTKDGKSLIRITESNPLNVGDKVIVRLVVRTDRDIEFVQLKDMRASCFEPVSTKSGVEWQNSLIYYQTTKDASTNFFFDVMPKGTYVFEYAVYANRIGEYSNGITSIQCAYAPEFTSHTAGIKVRVE